MKRLLKPRFSKETGFCVLAGQVDDILCLTMYHFRDEL
jgi:hypothetical protein